MKRVISDPAVEDVLRLAARGWRIHPCKAKDKVPVLTRWQDKATYDPSIIEQWSITYRECNWAVKTGADSGIWVLDCDGKKGMASLDALVRVHGDLWLETLTAITSNGQHSYFENPPDVKIRNSASKLSLGLDVRGDGGIGVAVSHSSRACGVGMEDVPLVPEVQCGVGLGGRMPMRAA